MLSVFADQLNPSLAEPVPDAGYTTSQGAVLVALQAALLGVTIRSTMLLPAAWNVEKLEDENAKVAGGAWAQPTAAKITNRVICGIVKSILFSVEMLALHASIGHDDSPNSHPIASVIWD